VRFPQVYDPSTGGNQDAGHNFGVRHTFRDQSVNVLLAASRMSLQHVPQIPYDSLLSIDFHGNLLFGALFNSIVDFHLSVYCGTPGEHPNKQAFLHETQEASRALWHRRLQIANTLPNLAGVITRRSNHASAFHVDLLMRLSKLSERTFFELSGTLPRYSEGGPDIFQGLRVLVVEPEIASYDLRFPFVKFG
jgi:hypothetical protein